MVAAPLLPVAPSPDPVAALLDAIRDADASMARAARLLFEVLDRGGVACSSGLPVEVLLRLDGRRTRWDARGLSSVAELVRRMPCTARALAAGTISFSQAAGIARIVTGLDADTVSSFDAHVVARAQTLRADEPEQLLWEVEELVARARDAQLASREQRAIDRSFLALQPRLGGGGALYGEADAEAFATIAEALDGAADRPTHDDDGRSRAEQRMDALVGVCEASLAGGSRGRARPRFLVSLDVTSADALGIAEAARVLARVAGRPVRLSRLTTRTLSCDATVRPILFAHGQPVAVGGVVETIPSRSRAAVVARDGGCRFPGCDAPAGWSDVHHLVPRARGGDHRVENLVLLCRRCHRRVHARGWRIRFEPDGVLAFTWRGRRYTTQPRARPPTG